MRLAIFGGTFDPIHNAHLTIAHRAADDLHLDRILFVPAAHPPHKAGVTHAPYDHRVRMVELACQGEPRFEVSRLEEGTARSYSIDTIEKLRAKLKSGDELFFIIGADAFAEIRTWHRWEDVARAVCFIVVSRPGHVYDVPPQVRIERLGSVDLPISSSDVRRALGANEYPASIPNRVLEYILKHNLYVSV
ncbi:MAG TPA: nicotinate-nucleotide adenylyltransferase [Bryobacteraceae bacterium]|jgi:nicotinate-nucleotide adenylyltransferase|nr:nicotinate-nucleotide adenylyltransferase [Bryobacteraceae bacterium]